MLDDHQRELVVENRGLIYYNAQKWHNKLHGLIEYDDLVGLGELAACKAADSYDHDKPASFATYATVCIDNEIRMELRKLNRKRKEPLASFRVDDADRAFSERLPAYIKEALSSKAATDQVNTTHLARQFIKTLNDREKVLLWYSYKGYTQKYTAQALGISQSYISRLMKGIRDRFKEYIKG